MLRQYSVNGGELCDGLDNNSDGYVDNNPECPQYSFFVLSDVQIDKQAGGKDVKVLQMAVDKMKSLDADGKAIAAFSVGDMSMRGYADEWAAHVKTLGDLFDFKATDFKGVNGASKPRYVGILGNHDGPTTLGQLNPSASWTQNWSSNLAVSSSWRRPEDRPEYRGGGKPRSRAGRCVGVTMARP
jgi:hypothetical protein